LCSTAGFEGFPNTFLEAWSHGLPVISTVDPDGIIAGFGLGRVANSVDDLVREIRSMLASPAPRERISSAARAYYHANHALEPSMRRFERLFQEVAAPQV
jgi:glycosyltransferase involved in cell wall biosynthesis